MKNLSKKTRAYALKNALMHSGKAQQGAVISALFNEGLKKEDIKKYIKEISKIVSEVNNLSLDKQKKEFNKLENEISVRKTREGLPELPLTPEQKKKGIIMRMAPSPSGAMHIGHALTASISYLYVREYGGKFYLRIEDTNPGNIYKPAYKLLKQDADWLFKKNYELLIQSDRMELYYKYAEKLIKKGFAYVCDCNQDSFKDLLDARKQCPCRKLSVKEELKRWEKMLAPEEKEGYKQGEAVLRFKSDIKHKNPAMRDFPLARINQTPHPLKGNKYRVWPLMNLAVAVDDIETKVTHIIRAKDHRDNALRQKLIFEALGPETAKKFPWTGFLGRYKFKDLVLSATKITQGIKDGKYSGWDDPQLPTIQNLKKKYKPEAFWKFAENRGLSEADRVIDKKEFFRLLDKFNKT